ncbi:MAG: argininosuccinate lyase [Chloroflexi bacterium]|nr:argininosuccinate lyase [Chloroflexota bacterium]
MSSSRRFPDPVYADTILAPQFAASQLWLFVPMLDASEAHLLMLNATGLMPAAQTAKVWAALQALKQAGAAAFAYDPRVEDLFFQMEARIVEHAGEEAGGNLHLARSRNDLDAAMARLALRGMLLEVHRLLEALRATLLRRIDEHAETLMPGHTHTQPAQPTTLGHFLAATAEALERDTVRVQAAWARTNRGPLGAAALTTTGFPIDRTLTAQLLGFDDVVINSYDAIGGVDYALEGLAAITTCALGLARLIHELLLWATREYGTLRIDDSFIQISSIMPQKRNPVVLEHLRARVAWVLGSAGTAQSLVQAAAFGDTVDVEDELYEPLFRTFEHGIAFLRLADSALATCQFDKERLAARATEGFTTATEIADTLVRHVGLSFRQAHKVASTVVRKAGGEPGGVTTALVSEAATEALGADLGSTVNLSAEQLAAALDPWAFVRARTIPGGPAPETVRAHAAQMQATLARDVAWRKAREGQVAAAVAERGRRAAALG